jgi:importin subunit beta-1
VPTLLTLLCKQDEDAADEEYNISRAAYQCLQLFAQSVGGEVIPIVLQFVEANLRVQDWQKRDAAVSAFGAIMEGPDEKVLEPLVKQALPLLLERMQDDNIHVRDSAAYALGRVCDVVPGAIDADSQLSPLIEALFSGLSSNPKMAASCCWALMSLAEAFCGEPGCDSNALSQHFQPSVSALLSVTEKTDANSQLRVAAYEVLNTFICDSANDCLPIVAKLSDVILQRLEATVPMQQQIVSVEDRMTLEEIQTSLAACTLAIIQRLETEIRPQADRIMTVLLQLLSSIAAKSSVPDAVFATIGALANALDDDFLKYMEPFAPFLYNALGNQDEPSLCSMAIGLVSDITRALNEKAQPFCDQFMNYLLNNLRSTSLSNQFKPAILQCFGDIAQAIGPQFETYLSVVGQVLQQAAGVQIEADTGFEMVEYIISLREGIMDAWSGIILAMKQGKGKCDQLQSIARTDRSTAQALTPYIESIFQLLGLVAQDGNRTEGLLRSAMGVIG